MNLFELSPPILVLLLVFLLADGFLVYAFIQLKMEKEHVAGRRIFGLLGLLVLLEAGILLLSHSLSIDGLNWLVLVLVILPLIVVLFPWPESKPNMEVGEPGQIDERTILFSRAELIPGSERFQAYYEAYPEHAEADAIFRAAPGLLNSASRLYHPFLFPAADATFYTVESLHSKIDGAVAATPSQEDPEAIWRFIQQWALEMGCHSIGISPLKPTHLYSVGGRKHQYNQPVQTTHTVAIAFTVEMDAQRVSAAPKGPIILESSQQYLHAGVIAVQLAAFLRNLGFSSRAHIDGNYQVRCPQVARDAGLGEIGRMGLLMTPKLGPRVRIAVVTTEAPFVPSGCKPDPALIRFCEICKKCAECCPSQAIPEGDRSITNGFLGWTVNQERCYQYWCQIGTDCGRCLAVCPYSHPDNAFHNLIRFLIRSAPLFRKAAYRMDNWIFGRKPVAKDLPDWMNPKN